MSKFILFDKSIIVIDDEDIIIEIFDTIKLNTKERIGSKINKFIKYNKYTYSENHKLFNTWNDLTAYYKIENCYLTGLYTNYYKNKQLKQKFYHNCFQKEGKYEEYNENGHKKLICNYINNKLHGKYEKYYSNDYLITSANYNDGLLNGPYKDTISEYNYTNNKKNGNFVVNYYKPRSKYPLFSGSNNNYYHLYGYYDNDVLLYVYIYIKYYNELVLLQKIYLDNNYKYMIKEYIYNTNFEKLCDIKITKNILDYKIYDYIEKFTDMIKFYSDHS
jgi:antitoxin component YwqK of YwqJK toxin-antitoxin module